MNVRPPTMTARNLYNWLLAHGTKGTRIRAALNPHAAMAVITKALLAFPVQQEVYYSQQSSYAPRRKTDGPVAEYKICYGAQKTRLFLANKDLNAALAILTAQGPRRGHILSWLKENNPDLLEILESPGHEMIRAGAATPIT